MLYVQFLLFYFQLQPPLFLSPSNLSLALTFPLKFMASGSLIVTVTVYIYILKKKQIYKHSLQGSFNVANMYVLFIYIYIYIYSYCYIAYKNKYISTAC